MREQPILPEDEKSSSDEEDVLTSRAQKAGRQDETLKPAHIKEKEKEATQSFLAMLEEKKKKTKMIPIVIASKQNDDGSESTKNRGFVSTFTSVGTGNDSAEADSNDATNDTTTKESPGSGQVEDNWQDAGNADNAGNKEEPTDKKLTAKELIERKRQRMSEGVADRQSTNGTFDPKSMIGKIKMAKKSFVRRKVTQSETPNLNADYDWYCQYYATYYAMDPYTAAYSAYYTMATSTDYTQQDLTSWSQQFGYVPITSDTFDWAQAQPLMHNANNVDPAVDGSKPSEAVPDSNNAQAIPVNVDVVPSAAKEVASHMRRDE